MAEQKQTEDQKQNQKRWLSQPPAFCDLCGRSFKTLTVFYDAKLPPFPWGLYCHSCFTSRKGRLGLGFGQKYSTKPPYLKLKG